jgi:hypothetical protein
VVESRSGFKFGPVSRASLRLGPYLDLAAPDGSLLCFCLFCRQDDVASACGGRHNPCPTPQQTDCRSAAEFLFLSPLGIDESRTSVLSNLPAANWKFLSNLHLSVVHGMGVE